MLCVIHDSTIKFNFPGIAKLLLNELSALKENQHIPNNPEVNGYIFEGKFFEELDSTKVLHIETMTSFYTFNVAFMQHLHEGEILKDLTAGVLYHLRYKHPVVDGVGVLEHGPKKV